jgi:uncharacterized protein YndB with AHSA1/START domain
MSARAVPFAPVVVDAGDESIGEQAGQLRLHLELVVAAPPERVFAAVTDADELRQWWGPKSFTVPHLQFDVAEGASYRITMQPPEGEAFHLGGTFHVVEAPRLLVFTFAWEEPDPDDQESVVTVSFRSTVGGTKLVLDQQPFKTEPRRQLHRDGWTETLDRLAGFLD